MSALDLLTLGTCSHPARFADDGTCAECRQAADAAASPFDQPTAADALADEAKLDRCLAALDSDDATLTDVRAVLHVLGRQIAPADPVRLMGICMRLSGALGRFGEHVLDAPPAAVADVVRDALVPCRNEACGAKVAPWHYDHNGCCDGPCEAAWLRTVES